MLLQPGSNRTGYVENRRQEGRDFRLAGAPRRVAESPHLPIKCGRQRPHCPIWKARTTLSLISTFARECPARLGCQGKCP